MTLATEKIIVITFSCIFLMMFPASVNANVTMSEQHPNIFQPRPTLTPDFSITSTLSAGSTPSIMDSRVIIENFTEHLEYLNNEMDWNFSPGQIINHSVNMRNGVLKKYIYNPQYPEALDIPNKRQLYFDIVNSLGLDREEAEKIIQKEEENYRKNFENSNLPSNEPSSTQILEKKQERAALIPDVPQSAPSAHGKIAYFYIFVNFTHPNPVPIGWQSDWNQADIDSAQVSAYQATNEYIAGSAPAQAMISNEGGWIDVLVDGQNVGDNVSSWGENGWMETAINNLGVADGDFSGTKNGWSSDDFVWYLKTNFYNDSDSVILLYFTHDKIGGYALNPHTSGYADRANVPFWIRTAPDPYDNNFTFNPSSVYEHEILHTFGALDEYNESSYCLQQSVLSVYPMSEMYVNTNHEGCIPHDNKTVMNYPYSYSTINSSSQKFIGWGDYDGDGILDPLDPYPYGPPAANFTASPTSGPAPLTVQFNDASTGSPTAWEWNFGDEDVTHWSERDAHSSVALSDGSIVLMGGLALNDTWRSTDKGVTWTLMNASSGWSTRIQLSAVALPDNSIVLMGGREFPSSYALNDTWRSTDMGATWVRMNASSEWSWRMDHCSVSLPDSSIVLIGGYDPLGYPSNGGVWRSTDLGATWTLQNVSSDAGSRTGHSAVALPNGSIVIIGGNSGYRDVWLSTDKGKTWTPQVYFAPWMRRSHHTSVGVPDGSILLMGGAADADFLNDVWRSTDQGKTWALVNASNVSWPPRYDHTSVILPDGTVTVMGGRESHFHYSLSDIWQSSDNGTTWSKVIINPTWISQEQNPSHIYRYPGTYTVTLNATNSAGRSTTIKTGYITVGTPVIPLAADFTADPTSGTTPMTVQFTDISAGSPTGWIWDFGDADGTNGTERNPVHTYQLPGTFTVSLTTIKDASSDTMTKNGYITVTPQVTPPTAGFTASPTTGITPLTVIFADQSVGQISSWLWDADNDGTYDCFDQACEYTYIYPDTYSPKLLVSGDGGFDDITRTDYITVTQSAVPPIANFTATPTTGTVPLNVRFTDLSTNSPTDWTWNFGDNSTMNATQKNPLHTYSANGIYNVSLTVTNTGGNSTKIRTNYIIIGNVTQTTQNAGSDTVVKFTGEGATSWTPPAGVSKVDYLVVGGGGSGGGYFGGGGGGGGVKSGTNLSVSGAIPVMIGAGGSAAGTNGGDSIFGSVTASGGGHGSSGGGNGTYYAATGGSGGGGGSTAEHTTGSAGISGQGNRGGNSSGPSGYFPSGGGGGAGAPGTLGNGLHGGNGGAGFPSSVTGILVYYGGGGGGGIKRQGNNGWPGTGGSGGGGGGGANYPDGGIHYLYPGSDGTNGLGGGGGGGGAPLKSPITHKGGSGIVIIRYMTPT